MRIDSITELLAAIDALPGDEGAAARRRVDAALEGPAPQARVALGLLALDLAGGAPTDAASAGGAPDGGVPDGGAHRPPEVIVVPELVAAARPRSSRSDRVRS